MVEQRNTLGNATHKKSRTRVWMRGADLVVKSCAYTIHIYKENIHVYMYFLGKPPDLFQAQ